MNHSLRYMIFLLFITCHLAAGAQKKTEKEDTASVINPDHIVGKWELAETKGFLIQDGVIQEYYYSSTNFTRTYTEFYADGTGIEYKGRDLIPHRFTWQLREDLLIQLYKDTSIDGAKSDVVQIKEINRNFISMQSIEPTGALTIIFRRANL